MADGQALDPVAEPEVVDQVDVEPGAAVAGAGHRQQVGDLGGRARPGLLQGPPGRLGAELAGGRDELPHPVGGAPRPGVVAGSTTEARRSTPDLANTSAHSGSHPGWPAKNASTISDCLNT